MIRRLVIVSYGHDHWLETQGVLSKE